MMMMIIIIVIIIIKTNLPIYKVISSLKIEEVLASQEGHSPIHLLLLD